MGRSKLHRNSHPDYLILCLTENPSLSRNLKSISLPVASTHATNLLEEGEAFGGILACSGSWVMGCRSIILGFGGSSFPCLLGYMNALYNRRVASLAPSRMNTARNQEKKKKSWREWMHWKTIFRAQRVRGQS